MRQSRRGQNYWQLVLEKAEPCRFVNRFAGVRFDEGLCRITGNLSMYLRWAKSRDSYRRIASESYRCDSNR